MQYYYSAFTVAETIYANGLKSCCLQVFMCRHSVIYLYDYIHNSLEYVTELFENNWTNMNEICCVPLIGLLNDLES